MLVIVGCVGVGVCLVLIMNYREDKMQKKYEKTQKIERLMQKVDISYEDMHEYPNDKEILLLKEYASNILQSDKHKS